MNRISAKRLRELGGKVPYSTLKPSPLKAKRGKPRRTTREIDPAYLDWIREQPCLVRARHRCGRIEPAHLKTVKTGGSDYQVVPLCGLMHRTAFGSLHNLGEADFEQLWGLPSLRETAAKLYDTYQRGEFR